MNKLLTLYNTKKLTSILAILFVIVIYTVIKAPYFDYNFTGEHSMKYSAYVEPAIHMVEKNDFTLDQRPYSANPITNPEGISDTLPQFPKIEWSVAFMMKIFSNLSTEVNTRLVMHMFGIVMLIFAFLSVKELANRKMAFIFSLLLATNPIIGLATFVTVYDSVILTYLFVSLYFLSLFLKNRKPLHLLVIAGTIAGFGIAAKVTLLLWIVPIVLLLLLFKSPNIYTKIFDVFTYFVFLLIPYVGTKMAIPTLGTDPLRNILILLLFLMFGFLFSAILQREKEKILAFLEKLHTKKLLLPILFVTLIPTILISLNFLITPALIENSLTDRQLIFNMDMYIFMARQFVRHLGIPLAILSVLGFVSLFFLKERNIKTLGISFLFSGLFFLITSSKSIFFHDYYTIFLMSVALLFSTIAIYFITEKIQNLILNTLIFILIFIFILMPRISSTQERFEYQEEGFEKALEYFIENTDEKDIYIDEVQATYFSLYSGRSRVRDLNQLNDEGFKKEVRDSGFKNTMDEYNIKYLITFEEEPNYKKFANIFSNEDLQRPSYRRSDLILSIVDPEKYDYFEDMLEREKIVEEFNLEEKFVFEKEIGNFRFFTFEN